MNRTKEEINCDIERKKRELENLECELKRSVCVPKHGDIFDDLGQEYLLISDGCNWVVVWQSTSFNDTRWYPYTAKEVTKNYTSGQWFVKTNIFDSRLRSL